MPVAGIVAEYNPFHTGHAYQIAQTRVVLGQDCAVVVVMSGNWVQQAHCAVADKWLRARLALEGGADLILELPTPWATASAESFAWGAVSLLHGTGVVDVLSFGSEQGAIEPLERIAACLDRPNCQAQLHDFLRKGLSFASARQEAVQAILREEGELLAAPNNNLGIEYIRALRHLGSPIRPMTVARVGSQHNAMVQEKEEPSQYLSATQLRAYLTQGEWGKAETYFGPGADTLKRRIEEGVPSLLYVERAILAHIRSMSEEDWSKLPDGGEEDGLPQRLERAGKQCTSLENFYSLAKTKRYTHARLRRLVLWTYLGLTKADIPSQPPYLRVLGLNDRGREVLRQMKTCATLPLLTKPAQAKDLDEVGQKLFRLEGRFTDLYDLCFPQIRTSGREWTTSPVIINMGSGLDGGG